MKIYPVFLAMALLAACSPQDTGSSESAATQPDSRLDEQAQHLGKVPLVIHHQDARPPTRLDVEIARTPEQQEKGLMHRADLKAGEGMIFPMLPARMPSFWMKDTPVPLDMIFIRMDTRVAKVTANAEPGDRTPVFAEEPVAAVLELRGGDAQRLGIAEGDEIVWGKCAIEAEPQPVALADNYCPQAAP